MKHMSFLGLVLIIILSGCFSDYRERSLNIINLSDEAIFSEMYYDITDTTISFDLANNYSEYIKMPGDTDRYIENFKAEFEIRHSDGVEPILRLFIFSADTIEQVPWERIQEEYLILKRYDLTLEDLEIMDFTVEFQ